MILVSSCGSSSLFGSFQDYEEMSKAYRPSHADATYDWKYGVRSIQVFYSYISLFNACFLIQRTPFHSQDSDFMVPCSSVQGGGRSSARETIGRVAAGAVAKQILKMKTGTEVFDNLK